MYAQNYVFHEMALNFIVSQLIVETCVTVRSLYLEFGKLRLYGFYGINVIILFFPIDYFLCAFITFRFSMTFNFDI